MPLMPRQWRRIHRTTSRCRCGAWPSTAWDGRRRRFRCSNRPTPLCPRQMSTRTMYLASATSLSADMTTPAMPLPRSMALLPIRRRRICWRGGCFCVRKIQQPRRISRARRLPCKPDLPLAHQLLGEVALARAQLPEAIMELNRERELNPLNGSVYDRLGDAYVRSGDDEKAREALSRAVLLEPNATGPYILLGKVMLNQQNYLLAELYLERAVSMDPGNYMAHTLLGQAYRRDRTDRGSHPGVSDSGSSSERQSGWAEAGERSLNRRRFLRSLSRSRLVSSLLPMCCRWVRRPGRGRYGALGNRVWPGSRRWVANRRMRPSRRRLRRGLLRQLPALRLE